MSQKLSNVKHRDWRIPDPSSPLQNLVKRTSVTQTNSTTITNTPNISPGKLKDVAKPTTFGQFLVILLMHFCRKILYVNLKYRLIIYLCSTVVVSLITDHFPPPSCFLSDSTSLINKYFVKYAWTLTCGVLAVFVYLTSNVFCCGQRPGINRNLSRLAILASWWYLCSYIFDCIEYQYGFCIKGSNQERFVRDLCTGRWVSFTISDRAFLLFHSMIVISEEVKAFVVWERLSEIFIKKDSEIVSIELSESQIRNLRRLHGESSSYVKATFIILAVLIALLDVASVCTIIYFHNMPQKLIANIFAIMGWILTYKIWFGQKSSFLSKIWYPGIPGQNLLIANR